MGLEAVKEEVIRQAKEQESAIIAEARKEANKIEKEAEKKIEEIKAKSEEDTKKAIDTMKRQALVTAEMESKKLVLESKKQVIENVFAEARKRLESLDEKRRESIVKKLVGKAEKELEVEYIYCNKNDLKIIKGFKAEPANIGGGIIAENRDRTIRIDYSFEAMLESIREGELQSINRVLFG